MKRIILDCDNTMGVPGCDVDDALALLYLLGKKACLKAITTTFGNAEIETVHRVTEKLLREIGRTDIALHRGGDSDEAARRLAEYARLHKGELSILAVGSLNNLGRAYRVDPDFFENIKEIVLMGGITEPLIVGSRPMAELNFSVDPASSLIVLSKGKNISILTGNNCLATLFARTEFETSLRRTESGRYILEKTKYWFDHNEKDRELPGFYNWDITAAIYLMKPELFANDYAHYEISERHLQIGYLKRTAEGGVWLNLPRIKDIQGFKKEAYDALSGVEPV